MSPQNSQLPRLVRKARKIPSRIHHVPADLGRFVHALAADPIETLGSVPEAVSHHLFDHQVAYDVRKTVDPPCTGCWAHRGHAVSSRISIGSGLTSGHPFSQGAVVWSLDLWGYSDADPSLSAVTWCAVRHLRPMNVIETGVARGVTSRVILEAMFLNGFGHLWSVDLPHPFRPELHHEIAAAVPSGCRSRWTYVRGSSRRQLPSCLSPRESQSVRTRQPPYRSKHGIRVENCLACHEQRD